MRDYIKYQKIDKLKLCLVTIVFVVVSASFAQNKDGISVILYSAKFIDNIDLENYKKYNLQTFYMEEHSKVFAKENINFLPTLILYNDGEEILKLESDISLKLKPVNWRDILSEYIEEIISLRF